MQVTHRLTHAEREREYRQRMGDRGRHKNAARMRASRAAAIPEFICVDSEGIGKGPNHRAVLLGVGTEHHKANDMSRGLQWQEIFEFLYSQYREHPEASFVGFYLSYDFGNWLSVKAGLPHSAAYMLFTKEGQAERKVTTVKGRRSLHPVRLDGWEFDMMGDKRLSIRPRPVGCMCYENKQSCTHKRNKWMHICDAGSFYQMKFLDVIKRSQWIDDPDGWVCTQEEYDKVERGKKKRDHARLDAEMVEYNLLENVIFARVMNRLAKGFHKLGIRLAKDEWYGPGAAAKELLHNQNIPKKNQLRIKEGRKPPLIPKWFWDAAQASYYGGWFEIFSHGMILGESWNYDINNAYPYAQTKLPHICRDGQWKRGNGAYNDKGDYVLLLATVYSKGERIGAVPNRQKDGSILRPAVTRGWYWKHEIDMARKAELVKRVVTHQWVEFIPCNHNNPLAICQDIYNQRLVIKHGRVEKMQSAYGMALKLTNNSISGKCAQTVGSAPYNNWLYASYITSHCRTQILEAIATHPGKANSVLMVATDGVCFDTRHPTLPVSTDLGEWEENAYHDLCLFKPGVYWHTDGKKELKLKSRGVPREEFSKVIDEAEQKFRQMLIDKEWPRKTYEQVIEEWPDVESPIQLGYLMRGWPRYPVTIGFRMKSPRQALNEGQWGKSAEILEGMTVWQDSDSHQKRRLPHYNEEKNRIDTVIYVPEKFGSEPIYDIQTRYYLDPDITMPPDIDYGIGWEGSAVDDMLDMHATIRGKHANYDLDLGEPQIIGYADSPEYNWSTVRGSK